MGVLGTTGQVNKLGEIMITKKNILLASLFIYSGLSFAFTSVICDPIELQLQDSRLELILTQNHDFDSNSLFTQGLKEDHKTIDEESPFQINILSKTLIDKTQTNSQSKWGNNQSDVSIFAVKLNITNTNDIHFSAQTAYTIGKQTQTNWSKLGVY